MLHTASHKMSKVVPQSDKSRAVSRHDSFRIRIDDPKVAWILKQYAAASRFHFRVFFLETVVNLFGWIALPYVLWRHGVIGAINRGFLTNVFQMLFSSTFLYFNAIAIWYYNYPSPDYDLSIWNLVMVDILFALRALNIGTKYATYLPSEYRALDQRYLSKSEISDKNMLTGWLSPSPKLLWEELEHARVRACPELDTLRIHFDSEAARSAVTASLVDSLPSYFHVNGYELKESDIAQLVQDYSFSSSRQVAPNLFATIFKIGHRTPWRREPKAATTPIKQADNSNEDKVSSPKAMLDSIHQHPLIACAMSPPIVADPSFASLSPTALPPALRIKQPEKPTLGSFLGSAKACLPAKLLLWHILYVSHIKYSTRLAKMGSRISMGCALVFTAIPWLARLVTEVPIAPTTWQSISSMTCVTISCAFWMMLQVAYAFMGFVDVTRRLAVIKEMNTLIKLGCEDAHQQHMRELATGSPTFHSPKRSIVRSQSASSFAPRHLSLYSHNDESQLNATVKSDDEGSSVYDYGTPRNAQHVAERLQGIDPMLRDLTLEEARMVMHARRKLTIALPVLFPANVLAWDCMRATAAEFGLSFSGRIAVFTAFNTLSLLGGISTLVYLLITREQSVIVGLLYLSVWVLMSLALLAAHVFEGARYNRYLVYLKDTVSKLEGLAVQIGGGANGESNSAWMRNTVQDLRSMARTAIGHIQIQTEARPARVMGVKADPALLGTVLSGLFSALIVIVPRVITTAQDTRAHA